MSEKTSEQPPAGTAGHVVVRYWAAARAAAGVESDLVDVEDGTTLDAILESVRLRHLDRPRFRDVVSVCSILVGDRPVGNAEPSTVVVPPGETVELLPPFAGG